MTIIIPEGYAQVTLNFLAPNTIGGTVATVLGFGGPLGDDPTSLEAFGDIVQQAWKDNLRAITDTQVTLSTVRVVGPTAAAEYIVGSAGTATSDDAPPNVACLINKVTPLRGRRARGRSFLYGVLADADISPDGLITGTKRTLIQTSWNGFIQDCTDPSVAGVDQVVLQNTEGLTPPISPPPVVTSAPVNQRIATQRRRLRR